MKICDLINNKILISMTLKSKYKWILKWLNKRMVNK